MKAMYVWGIVLVLVTQIGCEKTGRIEISNDNPPVIRVSGNAYFDWLNVQGPLPERMDDPGPSLIWKIVPTSAVPQLDDVPPITYGQVPNGFKQEVPQSGSPPNLIEGKIYGIGVVTRSRNHPGKTIVIRNGKAVDYKEGDYTIDSGAISSYQPVDVGKLKGSGKLYFIPLHYDVNTLRELAAYYKEKYGLQIAIEPELQIEFSRTYDVQRGQHIAQRFITAMKNKYSQNGLNGNRKYIGFEPQDMYIEGENWRFAYSYNDDKYAVISDSRLNVFASSLVVKARLRKVVSRTIGLLYYNLPLSDDPRSVMYRGLRGPDDLDRMSEEF